MQTLITGPDSAEFTTFMRAYQDMVFSTAARLLGNDAQAEDIGQEVFLRAYEKFTDLRTSPTAGGWLKTVAVNLSLNVLTRHRRRWRPFSDFGGDADATAAAQETLPGIDLAIGDAAVHDAGFMELDADQRRIIVDAALRRLPEHQRLVMVLYHFEDLSYQDIAEKLHCSLTKVKTDIHRARAALLVLLKPTGAREALR